MRLLQMPRQNSSARSASFLSNSVRNRLKGMVVQHSSLFVGFPYVLSLRNSFEANIESVVGKGDLSIVLEPRYPVPNAIATAALTHSFRLIDIVKVE